MEEARLKKVFECFTYYWKQVKQYNDIKPNDEQKWIDLVQECDDYVNSFDDDNLFKLAYQLCIATTDFLHREGLANGKK